MAMGLLPQARGWRPDHAHVTLGAAVATHSHPWDDQHDAPASEPTVGFADPDGLGGGAVIAIPASQSALDRLTGVTFEVTPGTASFVSHRSAVLTPPPRG